MAVTSVVDPEDKAEAAPANATDVPTNADATTPSAVATTMVVAAVTTLDVANDLAAASVTAELGALTVAPRTTMDLRVHCTKPTSETGTTTTTTVVNVSKELKLITLTLYVPLLPTATTTVVTLSLLMLFVGQALANHIHPTREGHNVAKKSIWSTYTTETT